jgi:hypothetical protein
MDNKVPEKTLKHLKLLQKLLWSFCMQQGTAFV